MRSPLAPFRRPSLPIVLAGGVLLALALVLLLPLLPASGPPHDAPLSPQAAKDMFTEVERRDASTPGRRRQVVVVEMTPGKEDILAGTEVLEQAVARAAARFIATREGLDTVEIRLRRRDGTWLTWLRHSPAGDGWDGTGDWSWQAIPLPQGD